MINLKIGGKIKNLRGERGWSQEQLAEKVGVRQAAIAQWENNTEPVPDKHIIKIAELFGVMPYDIDEKMIILNHFPKEIIRWLQESDNQDMIDKVKQLYHESVK